MSRFDFIIGKPFQETLEKDYAELSTCRSQRAWKSVQVLAGSIIEAVLIDYLAGTKNDARPKKDPLKMDLAEAIELCQKEGVLSERTSQLCSVVRSYRNLIHPGRTIRLNEPPPDENSATIAASLVDMIVGDVERVRQKQFGLTADQVVTKIERDPNALTILRHLLDEMKDTERERLLIDAIPRRYIDLSLSTEWDATDVIDRLRKAVPLVNEVVNDEARRAAMMEYIRVLREEGGDIVQLFDAGLFIGSDLHLANEGQIGMVKEHFLAKLKPIASIEVLHQFSGAEGTLKADDAALWIDPILRALAVERITREDKRRITSYVSTAATDTKTEFDNAVRKRLDFWAERFRKDKHEPESPSMVAVTTLKDVFDLPF